jgi:hypothetical protein
VFDATNSLVQLPFGVIIKTGRHFAEPMFCLEIFALGDKAIGQRDDNAKKHEVIGFVFKQIQGGLNITSGSFLPIVLYHVRITVHSPDAGAGAQNLVHQFGPTMALLICRVAELVRVEKRALSS